MEFYTGDKVKFTTHKGQQVEGIVKQATPLLSVYVRLLQTTTRIRPERASLVKPASGTPRNRKVKAGIPAGAISKFPFAEFTGGSESGATRHQQWGLIKDESETSCTIQLYGGALLCVPKERVCIYSQPPENWKELFIEGEQLTKKSSKARRYSQHGHI